MTIIIPTPYCLIRYLRVPMKKEKQSIVTRDSDGAKGTYAKMDNKGEIVEIGGSVYPPDNENSSAENRPW